MNVLDQGPPNGGVSNAGASRSGLVLFFCVLFWDFPDLLRDFPDLLGDGPGIFPICLFLLSRPIKSTYEEQSRKGPRHNLDLSRKKVWNPPVWKPPGLASLNWSLQWQRFLPRGRFFLANVLPIRDLEPSLILQSLLFWQKSEDPPKKARIFLSAEPLKSLEKRAKTHKKARKTAKRKKRGKRKKQGLEGQGGLSGISSGKSQLFGHLQACAYPDVRLRSDSVSGKAPLLGAMYLLHAPPPSSLSQGICGAGGQTLCVSTGPLVPGEALYLRLRRPATE